MKKFLQSIVLLAVVVICLTAAAVAGTEYTRDQDTPLVRNHEIDRYIDESDPETADIEQDYGRSRLVYDSNHLDVYNYGGELVGVRRTSALATSFLGALAIEGCCALALLSTIGLAWIGTRQ